MGEIPQKKPLETQQTLVQPEFTAAEIAQQAVEKGKNEGLREMSKLRPELPPEKQRAGFEVLKGYLISIIALLKEKNIPLSILKDQPQMLPFLVRANNLEPDSKNPQASLPKIHLQEDQRTALYNFERLMSGQGETTERLKDPALWAEMMGEGISISQNAMDKWKEWYADSPVLTTMVSAGVAVLGTGLLVKGLKSLLESKDKPEKTPEEQKFWTGKKMVGVGVAGLFAAAIFGRSHLVDFGKWLMKDQRIKAIDGENKNSVPKINKLKEANSERLDHPDGSNIVCVGDSMCHGFQLNPLWTKKPDFIGEDGMKTSVTLGLLKGFEKDKTLKKRMEGKTIILYTGGNSVGGKDECSAEGIVEDQIEMAEICKRAGAKEVIICTRFPIDPRRKQKTEKKQSGEAWFNKRQEDNKALRKHLIEAYQAMRFPAGTKMVDLYAQCENGQGVLRPEFVKGDDLIHPRAAYTYALNIILSEEPPKPLAVS